MDMRERLSSPTLSAFAGLAATAPLWLVLWWLNRRDRRRKRSLHNLDAARSSFDDRLTCRALE